MQPDSDDATYLNEQRESFDHCHGVSICETLPNEVIFSIILTATHRNENFAELVIKNKPRIIKYLQQLKQIDEYFILRKLLE